MRRQILAVCCAVFLAGCQQSVQKVDTPFDAKAAGYIHKQGEGRIDGHAFLKRFNGKVTNAAGEYVWLVPATPYARERFTKLYGGRKFLAATSGVRMENDPVYAEYTRKTKAESNGRFTFEKVAPGAYFVATTVTWKDSEDSYFARGGAIYETVTITGKEEKAVKVVVNGQ